MARLPNLLFGLLLGASLSCEKDDDGGDDHGSAEDGSESGTHDTGAGACADLGAMCHEPGEMMGGMAQECHDLGHAGDEAACEAIHDECIALCTGATTGADSSGSGSTG